MSDSECPILWRTTVSAIRQTPSDAVLAMAIDSPVQDDSAPGIGIEVNGWVIGRRGPVRDVRAVVDDAAQEPVPLDVSRPDVAADYPTVPYAANGGFSLWVTLEPRTTPAEVRIEARTTDGAPVTLALMTVNLIQERRTADPGLRPVLAPDVVIIGAQRGGTTSLHAYLAAHPQFTTPRKKELHYLTDRHHRGRDWYLGQFPATVPDGTLTGEATPYALFHPQAPRRLRAIAPDARLLVLLRNPVDRAYSHYLLERSRGDEPLAFEAALDAEAERLAGEAERLATDPTAISAAHNHFSYQARGDYASQLARWFALFPRDQFLILCSEDLYQQTEKAFASVTEFLALSPAPGIPFSAHNRSAGPALDGELRQRLERHFAAPNARLVDLLGWEAPWASVDERSHP